MFTDEGKGGNLVSISQIKIHVIIVLASDHGLRLPYIIYVMVPYLELYHSVKTS
jgi:hypothetical protein